MSGDWDRLYHPQQCSAWPARQLEAVGAVYRVVRGDGGSAEEGIAAAVTAYLDAGGAGVGAEGTVRDMLASLNRERGDWLWGPAQAFIDRSTPATLRWEDAVAGAE